jgi:hypothetical protein
MNVEKYHAIVRRWWRQEIRPLLILALVMFSIRSPWRIGTMCPPAQ